MKKIAIALVATAAMIGCATVDQAFDQPVNLDVAEGHREWCSDNHELELGGKLTEKRAPRYVKLNGDTFSLSGKTGGDYWRYYRHKEPSIELRREGMLLASRIGPTKGMYSIC